MRPSVLLLATLLLAPVGALFATEPSKPNIVFLLADDLSGSDLHGDGHP